MLGRSEHGITRDFTAGAGRGRYCNERQRRDRDRATFSHYLEKLERLASVGSDDGNRFAGVDYAAAANRNHDIAGGVLRLPRALADHLDCRLACHREGLRRKCRDKRLSTLSRSAGYYERS